MKIFILSILTILLMSTKCLAQCDVSIDGYEYCHLDITDYTGISPAPAISNAGEARVYFDLNAGKLKCSENGGAYTNCVGSSGGGTWGSITGTLSAQTDLQTALDAKGPVDATYITQTPNSSLSAEQALSALSTGIMKVTTSTGVISSVTAPSGTIVGDTDTQTLTNKRITSRVVAASDATSITPNSDNADMTTQANTQAVGTLTINADGGSPTNGQKWILRLTSTNIQTFSWNAVYTGSNDLSLPTTSTGSSKVDYYGFIYSTASSKWNLIAVVSGF